MSETAETLNDRSPHAPLPASDYERRAAVLIREQRPEEALKVLEMLRTQYPLEPEGYCRAAAIYMDKGEPARAESLCRSCMQKIPAVSQAYILHAGISLRRGDYSKAAARFQKIRSLFPASWEGYTGGMQAAAGEQDLQQARKLFHKGLKFFKADRSGSGNQTALKELYLQMMRICTRQQGQAQKSVALARELEQQYPETASDIRYYNQLADAAFFMKGRDQADFADPALDFILLRLLNQPLKLFPLVLSFLIYLFYTDLHLPKELFLGRLNLLIQKHRLQTPLAVLLSAASGREQRTRAYLEILRDGACHAVLLTWFHPQNRECLSAACREILRPREWESFDDKTLYRFVKALNFSDQQQADEVVAALAAKTNTPPELSTPKGALCLRHQNRQDLLPSQGSPNKAVPQRLSIALCVGGQLRGFQGTLESVVRALGLEQHEVTVFVHTWDNIGRKFPVPFHASRAFSGEFCSAYVNLFIRKKKLEDYLQQHYPHFYALLLNVDTASKEAVQQEFHAAEVVIEHEAGPAFAGWPNPRKMYYKIHACHQLAAASGKHFDLEIRMRPDLCLEATGKVDLLEIYQKSREELAVFNNRPFYLAEWARFYVTDDNFALGTPEMMEVYANTYTDLQKYGGGRLYDYPEKYSPHESLACSLYSGGVRLYPLPVKFTFKDPGPIPLSRIYQALCKDAQTSLALPAEIETLLQACQKDLKTQNIKSN